MRLADRAGADVGAVALTQALHRTILLVESIERVRDRTGWQRRIMFFTPILIGLRKMEAPLASYEDLAHGVRREFADSRQALVELNGAL
ncbi:hypothetical protein [Thiocapsa marina]|uniref:HipA domain-containing protein n=1 Tax=Thiocapsa marina 5811 TaxID=768671 RepID=F9UHW8_9GAMM|nr:hypothetical protein [Thiocapsa marina]EGV16144.1 HipA domain-containing protein [Thiocapsa marina 5811]